MSRWKKCTLSELGIVVGGATPSTKNLNNYKNGTIAWITPKDLAGFSERFIFKGERNITEQGLKSCSTKLLPRHSILFSSRAPIGYVAIAGQDVCTNQGFKSIIPSEEVDYMFLYYLLKNNKDRIESMGSGTTFKEISGKTMGRVEVIVPSSIEDQRKISSILSVLDERIEVNNRINKNLEEQAQHIFTHSFLHIDKIPDGWKESSLLEVAHYLNGLAMQKYRPNDEDLGIPVLKIKELRQGFCDSNSELCSSSISSDYIVQNGDMIFSWSGSLLVDFWCGGTCGLNQHLFKVTSTSYDKWFYYSWTKYHLQKFIAIASDKATTMGHIKRADLEKAKVLIPSSIEYNHIGNLLTPLYNFIIANRIMNKKLYTLRDELLSQLMSGELDVSALDI